MQSLSPVQEIVPSLSSGWSLTFYPQSQVRVFSDWENKKNCKLRVVGMDQHSAPMRESQSLHMQDLAFGSASKANLWNRLDGATDLPA